MRRSHHAAMLLAATLCAATLGGCNRSENATSGVNDTRRNAQRTPSSTQSASQANRGKKGPGKRGEKKEDKKAE